MAASIAYRDLRDGLLELGKALRAARFRLPTLDQPDLERERRTLVRTIESYLLPRIEERNAIVYVMVAGATGTGKSAIVNGIAQRTVSAAGFIRPTTRIPVLWTHEEHAADWAPRSEDPDEPEPELAVLVDDAPLLRHVALIDTPPIDVSAPADAMSAVDLLALSDAVVYVTSPGRYADAVGWGFLAETQRRGIPVLFVLNRLPADEPEAEELTEDLTIRLYERDLLFDPDPNLIFGIREGPLATSYGGLTNRAVAELRSELEELSDQSFRQDMMDHATSATTATVAQRARALVQPLDDDALMVERLSSLAAAAYDTEVAGIKREIAIGHLGHLAGLPVWAQAEAELAGIVTRRAGVAAQRTAIRWSQYDFGRRLLDAGGRALWRHGPTAASDSARDLDAYADLVIDRASELARRGSRGSWASRRAADVLWRRALDPSWEVPRRVHRRYGPDLEDVVRIVRDSLADVVARCLMADGARFEQALGPRGDDDAGAVSRAAETLLLMVEPEDRSRGDAEPDFMISFDDAASKTRSPGSSDDPAFASGVRGGDGGADA